MQRLDCSDRELVAQWCAGERAAGDELVARHRAAVARLLRRLDGRAADDLTQETFLRFFRAAHHYCGHAQVWTYLYRIACNVAYDERRRTKSQCEPMIEFVATPDSCPEQRRIRGERDARVAAALSEIPEVNRRIVYLHYWCDRTTEQIGGELGMPVGTVRFKLRAARQQLLASSR